MKSYYSILKIELYNFILFSLDRPIYFTSHPPEAFYYDSNNYDQELRSEVLFTSGNTDDLKFVEDFLHE